MTRRLLHSLAALMVAMLSMVATSAVAADSYITMSGEASRAVDKLVAKIGRTPRAHSIRITDRQISMEVEGERRAADVDEWRVGYAKRFFIDFEVTGGPFPMRSPGLVADVTGGYFALADVALARTAEIAAAAIAHAGLEDTATVQQIEIQRQVSILPTPGYGDVRWNIYVTSGRESATIRTDAAGRIVGADLSNTNRTRSMNLIMSEDWPKEEALAALRSVIGEGNRLRDFTVYPRSLSLKADHASLPNQIQGFGWTVSGVTRDPILTPLFPGRGDAERFALADIDLSNLAAIRDTAIKAWGYPKFNLNYMMLRKSVDNAAGPELRWVVNLNDIGAEAGELAMFGASGTVEIGLDGKVRSVRLPDYRTPKRPNLSPQLVADTLARLAATFGEKARFAELMVSDRDASVLAEDRSAPGRMQSYRMDEQEVRLSGTPMPWNAEAGPERLFTAHDLAYFSSERLTDLTARTYQRLGVTETEMPLSRFTFSVGQLLTPDGQFMVPSPDGRVTLEIRVEANGGWKGGRVTYSSDGREIDVVTP